MSRVIIKDEGPPYSRRISLIRSLARALHHARKHDYGRTNVEIDEAKGHLAILEIIEDDQLAGDE